MTHINHSQIIELGDVGRVWAEKLLEAEEDLDDEQDEEQDPEDDRDQRPEAKVRVESVAHDRKINYSVTRERSYKDFTV